MRTFLKLIFSRLQKLHTYTVDGNADKEKISGLSKVNFFLIWSVRISFALGIFLLFLNLAGFFIPLRNADVFDESESAKGKITFSKAEVLEAIKRKPADTNETFVTRVNEAIFKGVAHYWNDEGIDKYHLRVPPWENYLLYLRSFTKPQTYLKYEFCDYRKAIERRVGLCSQQSLIISGILEENGFKTKILSLYGHVVASAEVSKDKWWIVGPDYGIVIPHSIEEIENNPEIVRPYYTGYGEEVDNLMVKLYGKEGNRYFNGVDDYCGDKKIFEEKSYKLIWVIPVILVFPFIFYKLLGNLKQRLRKRLQERNRYRNNF